MLYDKNVLIIDRYYSDSENMFKTLMERLPKLKIIQYDRYSKNFDVIINNAVFLQK